MPESAVSGFDGEWTRRSDGGRIASSTDDGETRGRARQLARWEHARPGNGGEPLTTPDQSPFHGATAGRATAGEYRFQKAAQTLNQAPRSGVGPTSDRVAFDTRLSSVSNARESSGRWSFYGRPSRDHQHNPASNERQCRIREQHRSPELAAEAGEHRPIAVGANSRPQQSVRCAVEAPRTPEPHRIGRLEPWNADGRLTTRNIDKLHATI